MQFCSSGFDFPTSRSSIRGVKKKVCIPRLLLILGARGFCFFHAFVWVFPCLSSTCCNCMTEFSIFSCLYLVLCSYFQ